MQLLDDMIPYYGRISVYDVDRDFIQVHKEQCMRLALAARKVTTLHTEMTPEQAIFSDQLFGQLVAEAWQQEFDQADREFFNAHLQECAECFRMGIMMADLPQM